MEMPTCKCDSVFTRGAKPILIRGRKPDLVNLQRLPCRIVDICSRHHASTSTLRGNPRKVIFFARSTLACAILHVDLSYLPMSKSSAVEETGDFNLDRPDRSARVESETRCRSSQGQTRFSLAAERGPWRYHSSPVVLQPLSIRLLRLASTSTGIRQGLR